VQEFPSGDFNSSLPTPNSQLTIMRLTSLDVFRGMTIAAMILVNTMPDDTPYTWLVHPEWHGFSLADLVFPSFLFIMGVAMAFSLGKYAGGEKAISKHTYWGILRRSLILFGLGLILNKLIWNYNLIEPKFFDLEHLRIMGVLQRIGIAYFLAAIAVLNLKDRGLWIVAGTILVGYWLILTFVPAPDNADGVFSLLGNFSSYVDRSIIAKGHLHGSFKQMGDPEGLFSTLPATVNVLFGYLTGIWLKRQPETSRTSTSLLIFGLVAVVIGLVWSGWFPLNKKLWTSSFVVFTTGWSLILLAGCYELVDVRKYRKWFKSLEMLGLNPIVIFFSSIVLLKIFLINKIGSGEKAPTIAEYLIQNLLGWAGTVNSGLLAAIFTVLFWVVIAYVMYRQKLFIKI
jgi:predicted acyltransferase